MRALALLLGALSAGAAGAQTPAPTATVAPTARLICTRQQLACAALVPVSVTRSLAAHERERAEHALERLPMSWQVVYLLVPRDDPQALDELNLLLIAQFGAQAAK
jgi:hypothetical protein